MERLVKKYFVELILLMILLICTVALIVVKVNNSKEERPTEFADLFTYENPEGEDFYTKINRMREEEYNRSQVVSLGEKVRIVEEFSSYQKGDIPNFLVSVDKAYIADTFCGVRTEGRKYLVVYMTVENTTDVEGELFLMPQYVYYYNKQDMKIEPAEVYCGDRWMGDNYGLLYHRDADRAILTDGIVDKFYYSLQWIRVPAGGVTAVKMIYPIEAGDDRLYNSDYELLLDNNIGSKFFFNTGYRIRLPFDKITRISNVNDGWDDAKEEKTGNMYEGKKRLGYIDFMDMQVKNIGETASCYMAGGRVNITLQSATLTGADSVKTLKLNLLVENTGTETIEWNEIEDFNIVCFRQKRRYYNYAYGMVEDWQNEVVGNDVSVKAMTAEEIELVIPLDYTRIPEFMAEAGDYMFGFQLIPKALGGESKLTNEYFGFRLEWDKVVME